MKLKNSNPDNIKHSACREFDQHVMAQLQAKDSVLEEEESTNFSFGSLIGGNINNVLVQLSGKSRRSLLMTQQPPPIPIPIPIPKQEKKKKSSESKTNWILCTKLKTDALGIMNNNAAAPSSLAHLLEIERRHHAASSNNHQRQSLHIKYTTWSCGASDFTKFLPASGKRCSKGRCLVQEKKKEEEIDDYATPLLLSSCLCGDPKTH